MQISAAMGSTALSDNGRGPQISWVQNVIKKWQWTGRVAVKIRSGTPGTLSDRAARRIARKANENPCLCADLSGSGVWWKLNEAQSINDWLWENCFLMFKIANSSFTVFNKDHKWVILQQQLTKSFLFDKAVCDFNLFLCTLKHVALSITYSTCTEHQTARLDLGLYVHVQVVCELLAQ